MLIANPIYDAVFKYLMDDQRAAKLILSALIDLEIEEIQLRPTEIRTDKSTEGGFTVCHLDFAARVRTSAGPKLILIEIQKAKFSSDIMRFRKYLGHQYASPLNCQVIENPVTGRSENVAEPIFTIYFLGHRLEHAAAPVIRVARGIQDVATGEVFPRREEFIESLTHDCVIIQIPELRERRRTKLEKLLAIFDQTQAKSDDPHVLRFDEKSLPEEFSDVIRPLLMAHAQEDLRYQMDMEDLVLSQFQRVERDREKALRGQEEERRLKDNALRAAEEERRLKDEALRAQEEERRQKEEALRGQEEERRQKEEERRLKDEALRAKEETTRRSDQMRAASLQFMLAQGMSEAEARKILGDES